MVHPLFDVGKNDIFDVGLASQSIATNHPNQPIILQIHQLNNQPTPRYRYFLVPYYQTVLYRTYAL